MKRIKYFIYILISISICIVSCKKAPGPDLLLYVASPTIQEIVTKETTVSVDWDYAQDSRVIGFVAQISLDRNFATIFKTDTVDANSRTVDFEDVTLVTEYFVRVRALASNIVISSDFAVKSLKLESIFLPTVRTDIKANQVTLKWTAPSTGSVSNIILLKEGTALAPIQLSSTDITNRTVTISGLSDATLYTALIYDGEERKGVITFTTKDINEKITINSATTIYETLQDAVTAAVNNDVINIGGAIYDFSTLPVIDINKSLTIKVVPDATKKPIINMAGFNITGASTLKLIGVDFAINAATSQIFVGTSLNGTAQIEIEDCEISGAKNGLLYVANTNTTGVLGIAAKNSIFKNTGFDGGDYIDFRGGKIKSMIFENCTFNNVGRTFVRFDSPVTIENVNQPVTFTNCTINQVGERVGSNGGQLVNIRTAVPILFTKSILTNKRNAQANGLSGGGTGRFVDNVIFGTNSTTFNGGGFTSTNVVTLNPEYKDEPKGDLTVQNATVKALGYGDPRWLQ